MKANRFHEKRQKIYATSKIIDCWKLVSLVSSGADWFTAHQNSHDYDLVSLWATGLSSTVAKSYFIHVASIHNNTDLYQPRRANT